MIPTKKELEIMISAFKSFEKPKPELEQYITPSNIASEMLWTAFMDGNIKGKKVADFGAGTGIFSIGASMLGALSVVGYEIDASSIKTARENVKVVKKSRVPLGKITFQKSDISEVKKPYDTIIMNPPFGIQKKHADKFFLEKAFGVSKKAIYSIHSSDPKTDRFLENFASDYGFLAFKLSEVEFPIKATMEFHEKPVYPVNAALWRFVKM